MQSSHAAAPTLPRLHSARNQAGPIMLYPNPGPQRLPAADAAVATEFVGALLFGVLAGVAYDAAGIAAAFAAIS